MSSERNERYFALHGYGFGRIGCAVATLRTLTPEQVNAVAELILLGDIAEIACDVDLLGPRFAEWADKHRDEETQTRLQAVAALVYASGRLAVDLPALRA